MNPSRLRLMRKGLIVLAVVFPLLYIYVQYVALHRDHRITVTAAESETRKMAAALKEHAARAVGEADRVLQAAMGELDRSGVPLNWDNRVALESILHRYMLELPQISKMTVIDGKGMVLAVSGVQIPESVDVTDTGYYKYHEARHDGSLFMTATYKSRVNDRQVFAITRSLLNADGSLKAIVLCSMRADYFGEFYRTLGASKSARVMLISDTGSVLVGSPGNIDLARRDLSMGQNFARFKDANEGTFRTSASLVDGTARIASYAHVPNYPLVVTVGLLEDEVLLPWRERRLQTIIVGAASILVMLALIGLLWRQLTELIAAQATLQDQNDTLRKLNEELEQQAIADALTGLHNRRYFNGVFQREIMRARRTGTLLAFCIGDMDHFKKFNDRYGHPKGDLALQRVAQILRESLQRATDYAFRLGGEEFALLYSVQSAEEAWQIVEVTRHRIEQLDLAHEENEGGVATMSFGLVCVLPGAEIESETLYSLADSALYKAKAAGRNCTVRKTIRPNANVQAIDQESQASE